METLTEREWKILLVCVTTLREECISCGKTNHWVFKELETIIKKLTGETK